MNFLAHLYLSGNDPKIKVGNFIGDFVRGRNLSEQFEPAIVRGIELHREIDAFTDKHPIVKQSKVRLRPKYRHYAPVIVDVFYDHFLAHNWTNYSNQPLTEFADEAYHIIQLHKEVIPEQVNRMLPYMISGNWLVNYSKVEGIHRALTGMARRTPYDSKMDESIVDLTAKYEEFQQEFSIFFPDLINKATTWLNENKLNPL